jgi:hypothetical protein
MDLMGGSAQTLVEEMSHSITGRRLIPLHGKQVRVGESDPLGIDVSLSTKNVMTFQPVPMSSKPRNSPPSPHVLLIGAARAVTHELPGKDA